MRAPNNTISPIPWGVTLAAIVVSVIAACSTTWAQDERRHGTVVDLETGALSTYSGTVRRGTIIDLQTGDLSTYHGNARGGTILDQETGGLSTYQLNPGGGGTVLDLETGTLSTFGN